MDDKDSHNPTVFRDDHRGHNLRIFSERRGAAEAKRGTFNRITFFKKVYYNQVTCSLSEPLLCSICLLTEHVKHVSACSMHHTFTQPLSSLPPLPVTG